MMLLPNHWRNLWHRTPPNGANGNGHTGHSIPDAYTRLRLPRTLRYPRATLGQVLDQSADRFPDAPAVDYGDLHWTYAELLERVNRLAGGLAEMGVKRGDRVMLTLPNCPEFVVGFLAVQKLGAIVVNAGPLMGVDDLHKIIEMTEPTMVIALDLQAPHMEQASEGLDKRCWLWVSLKSYLPVLMRMGYRVKKWKARQALINAETQVRWRQLLERSPARPPTVLPDPEDVALLQPTGGTTGTLKVAQLSHRNLLSNAAQLSTWVKLVPGQDSILGILPMFHVYGLMLGLVTTMYSAGRMIPLTRFKVHQLMDVVRQYRPSMIPLVPAIFEAISDELEREPDDDLCGVFRRAIVMSGAAPLSDPIAKRFTNLTGAPIVQGYGLTEASPVTHANPEDAPRLSSIGVALPDTYVRIVDLHDPTRDANIGQPGELWIRGPQVFRGYLHNPDETEEVLSVDEQGRTWLHTGDVAQMDEDGFVYIIDRKKHMINCAGLKVWPRKVERVLKNHPKVKDAAAVGRANPKTTEDVVAFVVLADDSEDEAKLSDELRTLCREHLAPYEVPSEVAFVDELPRSALGKLLKHRLQTHDDVEEPAAEPAGVANNGNGQETH